uniref:Uncharacterized protein n=1 Tax=Arundo donax TaxID=35708 RepID=A0A0A9BFR2_ARUDO
MISPEGELPAILGLEMLPMHVAVMPFVTTSSDSTHQEHQRYIFLLGCFTWIEAGRSLIETTWPRLVILIVKH